MPKLLDTFYRTHAQNQTEMNGRWWIAKPLRFFTIHDLPQRFLDAWLILLGKATAVQFAEDYFVNTPPDDSN